MAAQRSLLGVRRFDGVHSAHGEHEQETVAFVLSVRYKDWHRVERALETFAIKPKSLQQHGWADQSRAWIDLAAAENGGSSAIPLNLRPATSASLQIRKHTHHSVEQGSG